MRRSHRSKANAGVYRILRLLGSGGMGEVYLAERADDEYQQHVAIKIVRNNAFSHQIQARLRMERQILASLQHPNIARLLDGGRTPDGRPYLVMEYIEGEQIDSYCDRKRLTLEERVDLIRTVCSAVHYARQNLVVHRDLKPNNILIRAMARPSCWMSALPSCWSRATRPRRSRSRTWITAC
jgi:serine/threonine-protein kinase